MINENEIMQILNGIQRLPKNSTENLDKNGNRIPITMFIAKSMYDRPLNIITFQNTASTYFKTRKVGSKIWLTAETTGNTIVIDFCTDLFNYMKIDVLKNGTELTIPAPEFNSHLFQKIASKKLF